MLRRGEILGLRDIDLDLEAGSVSVFAQHQNGERVSTKTRAATSIRAPAGQAAVTLEAHIFGQASDSAVGQTWDGGQSGLDLGPA